MTSSISSNIWNILVCSSCGNGLAKANNSAKCPGCGLEYQYTHSGSLDLRLKSPKKCALEFEIGTPPPGESEFQVEPLTTNPKPEVDYSGLKVPRHLTKEILSYFPKAKSPESLMLDLGCGSTIHKGMCEHAGFEWVGLDYNSLKAPLLGDGHALPFQSNSFEFILSIAVLEHIRYPFVMMREAYRVLKPHGTFIGTVAFLEPFHSNSYYHHTYLGTINSLQYGGFTIKKLAPSKKWSVLVAQAVMGLFPRMPRFLSRTIVYPVHLLHRLWWLAARLASPKVNELYRIKSTSGSITFIATKGTV